MSLLLKNAAPRYYHEDVAEVPRGWKVRTVAHKSGAQARIAFPPGGRREGSGRLVSILYPTGKNPAGLHLSLCTDPDFTRQIEHGSEFNPRATSYLEAARRAVSKGMIGRAQRALKKYVDKRHGELKVRKPSRYGNPVFFNVVVDGKVRSSHKTEADAERHAKQWAGAKIVRVEMNPTAEQAAQSAADFHGRDSDKVVEYSNALMASGDYAGLGNDPRFWLQPVKGEPDKWPHADIWWDKRDAVKLVWDGENHAQLYIVGKDTSLPLSKEREFDTSKRFLVLGTAYGISYDTEKVFDQDDDDADDEDEWETVTYAHQFGEETGKRPLLIYDQETKTPFLAGGAYYIKDYDAELGASPGIAN